MWVVAVLLCIYFAIEPVQSLIGVKVGGAAKSSRLIGVMARTLILRPARLAPFVAAIGYHEGVLPPGRERVLPSGHTELMLNVVENEFRTYPGSTGESRRTSGAVIRGPSSRPAVIDTAEQRGVITVSFHPGGATAFVPASLSALADQTVDVAELWGSAGSVLREWVLEVGAPEQRLRRVEEALLERLDVGRAHWTLSRTPPRGWLTVFRSASCAAGWAGCPTGSSAHSGTTSASHQRGSRGSAASSTYWLWRRGRRRSRGRSSRPYTATTTRPT